MRAVKCRRSATLSFFHGSLSDTSAKFGKHDITIRVGFGTEVAKTLTYPVICPFSLPVALCDHNSPTLQTDRQTNGRHARSIARHTVE